jgi:hypothetical protein
MPSGAAAWANRAATLARLTSWIFSSAVAWWNLAAIGRYQQQIAGRHRIQRHGLQGLAPVPAGVLGRLLQQRPQIVACPPGRPRLQRPPAGQHHADHRGGQQLAHHQRANDRQQGDDIHPEPAVGERLPHGPQGVARAAGPHHGPDRARGIMGAGQVQAQPRRQARDGQRQQYLRRAPDQPYGTRERRTRTLWMLAGEAAWALEPNVPSWVIRPALP